MHIRNIIGVVKITKKRIVSIFFLFFLLILYLLIQKIESKNVMASSIEFEKNIDDYEFALGGEITGIKLLSTGVLVIDIENEETDLKVGDIILKVNGKIIESNNELTQEINKDNVIRLTIQREQKEKEVEITPIYNPATDKYELGLWVKDSSAGVGTITFYEKNNKLFGGLRAWNNRNRR